MCSAQSKDRYNSGIVLRKVGILTLSANSGIVPDNSRIAQVIYVENVYGMCPCAKWEELDKVRIRQSQRFILKQNREMSYEEKDRMFN